MEPRSVTLSELTTAIQDVLPWYTRQSVRARIFPALYDLVYPPLFSNCRFEKTSKGVIHFA